MLTLTSLLLGGVALVAFVALFVARRALRRLDRLSESYWDLRYENGQLKARLTRLEKAVGPPVAEEEQPRPAMPTAFVPLSSLRK